MHSDQHIKSKNANRLSRLIPGITFLLLCSLQLSAQTDTVKTATGKVDTQAPVRRTEPKAPSVHSPKRAALYSAALPGLGQAYNRKYWKIPVLYAGAAGIGYAISFTNRNYQEFRTAYRARLEGDTTLLPLFTAADLKRRRDYWHRNRDLSIMGGLALYTIQIIDATVDAHLYKFDEKFNESLTLQVRPRPYMGMLDGKAVSGVCVRLKF